MATRARSSKVAKNQNVSPRLAPVAGIVSPNGPPFASLSADDREPLQVGVHPVPGGGADDRLEGGAQVRPPGGAEAASDLAVHHHRPKITLAAVVVRRRVGVLEKGEQAVTHREVALAQAPSS